MAKDLYLDVVARKNSKDLSALADEFDKAAKQTDDFGKKMNKTGTFSQFLDKELANTKLKAKELGEEFEKTGNKDVFASLKGAQSNIKSLERIKKDLGSALDDGAKEGEKAIKTAIEDGGKSGFDSLSKLLPSALQGALSTPVVGPALTAGIIAGVIAAAPFITAAIGGAVIAGGGLGLIGAGIAGQMHTPQVQAALDELEKRASSTFKTATSSFAPVLVSGARQFESEIDRIGPKLTAVFTRLAPVADKIFGGVAGFVDELMPGIDALSHAAGPVLGQLSRDLPQVGGALSHMLEDISADAPGAALALHDLFTLVEGGIEVTGKLVHWGETAYKWIRLISATASGKGTDVALSIGNAGAAADDTAGSFDTLGDSTISVSTDIGALTSKMNETTQTADTLAAAMADKLFNSLMSADQATLGVAESQTRLTTALDQNGLSLKLNSEKGQANREAILSVVQANIKAYDTAIQSGTGATTAAAAYDKNTAALNAQLLHAGYAQSAINGLIGKYKEVPDDVNTDIAMHGLTDALNDLDDLLRKINGIPKNITIREHVYSYTSPSQTFHGLATGGPVTAGHPYLVGEEGPEMFVSSQPGYIVPNDQIQGLKYGGGNGFGAGDGASLGGGRAGGGATEVVFRAVDPQAAWLLTQLRAMVSSKGGGSTQKTFGSQGVPV
jgi:hypothetical protein